MASLNPISGVLGQQKASHLLRRATMGPSLQDIANFSSMTAQDALTALLQTSPTPPYPKDPNTNTDWIFPNNPDPNQINDVWSDYTKSWWLENMRISGCNLHERMVWFYHTHIPVIMTRISGMPQYPIDYLRLLRYYALGNFRDLAKAICIDNAMLVHLDGYTNVKGAGQENFAREFMELFTVGKGLEVSLGNYTNFTEVDVKALTKVFTGWDTDPTFQSIDQITGIPTGKVRTSDGVYSSQHDVTPKVFSQVFNNAVVQTANVVNGNTTLNSVKQELNNAVDLILNSTNAAYHLCRRIYREFVYFDITPEIENDIIQPLANVFLTNNYDVKPVLEMLLQSEHFYDLDTPATGDNNIGAIIKSPVDLVIGTLRLFGLSAPNVSTQLVQHYQMHHHLIDQLSLQGLNLFEPVDVAGYDPYFQVPDFQRYWISANYLANRYKFAELLITGFSGTGGVLLKLDVMAFVNAHASNPANETILVQELVDWLFPITLEPDRFTYFKEDIFLNQLTVNWANEWANYQTTSSETVVRAQLEKLIKAMMQSPEYQIY